MVESGRGRVLVGVPRVGFYGEMVKVDPRLCPEDMPLPSCLRALSQYLGVDWLGCRHLQAAGAKPDCECAYAYFTGARGQGFMFNWNPQEWDFGNGPALYLAEDALAPVRWGVEAMGYEVEAFGNAAAVAARCEGARGRPASEPARS